MTCGPPRSRRAVSPWLRADWKASRLDGQRGGGAGQASPASELCTEPLGGLTTSHGSGTGDPQGYRGSPEIPVGQPSALPGFGSGTATLSGHSLGQAQRLPAPRSPPTRPAAWPGGLLPQDTYLARAPLPLQPQAETRGPPGVPHPHTSGRDRTDSWPGLRLPAGPLPPRHGRPTGPPSTTLPASSALNTPFFFGLPAGEPPAAGPRVTQSTPRPSDSRQNVPLPLGQRRNLPDDPES